MLTVKAPAKINLTLEVLRKRPDGFHEIRSVLQAIDLSDTLYIEAGQGITWRGGSPGWSAEKSLVSKAAGRLRETTGCAQGAAIKIDKRIPLMSGLGGDSSDAAALLRGLNEFWGLKLPEDKLAEIAAGLGSDVVFFLKGGTALAAGRGEKITPLPPLNRMWVVLVAPDAPVAVGKTGRMYANLKPAGFTDGADTRKLADDLSRGKPFKPAMLFNVFESVAFEDYNVRRLYIDPMKKMGALHVHLAGSGPALFTMLPDQARAGDIYNRCIKQGMQAYLARTL
ncbi:MAG: 4-(cytidine 5'-diphospho)-2-C-methyl-D-erythritol kinase [Dehalococcoidales bacterium]